MNPDPDLPKKLVKVTFRDLGTMPYREAWDYQESLLQEIVRQKTGGMSAAATDNYLLFVEHPHVFTLGKSGSAGNLLAGTLQLQAKHAEFVRTNRGGDITYHGPGQIVGYPVLNLDSFTSGIRDYIDQLEESVILFLADYGITGTRLAGATGVWLDAGIPGRQRKICAMGVRVSRGVSMHGFALNLNTDLSYFSMINPCGFTDKAVTSLEKELGARQDMESAKTVLKSKIAAVFGMVLT